MIHDFSLDDGPGFTRSTTKPRAVSFQTVKLDLLLARPAKIKFHVPSKPNMLSCGHQVSSSTKYGENIVSTKH
jgi:hypothetical protein